jgi:hypothetical protein
MMVPARQATRIVILVAKPATSELSHYRGYRMWDGSGHTVESIFVTATTGEHHAFHLRRREQAVQEQAEKIVPKDNQGDAKAS